MVFGGGKGTRLQREMDCSPTLIFTTAVQNLLPIPFTFLPNPRRAKFLEFPRNMSWRTTRKVYNTKETTQSETKHTNFTQVRKRQKHTADFDACCQAEPAVYRRSQTKKPISANMHGFDWNKLKK